MLHHLHQIGGLGVAHPKPCWQGANSWSSQPIFLCPKHRRTIKSLSILSCGLPNSHQQRHRALLTQLWASPQGVAELDASGQHDKKQHQSKEAEASAEGGNGNGVEPGQGTQRPKAGSKPSRKQDYEFVDKPKQLVSMLEDLRKADVIALDCEGVKLGAFRDGGKLSLVQISAHIPSGGGASSSKAGTTAAGSKGSGKGGAGSGGKSSSGAVANSSNSSSAAAANGASGPNSSSSEAGSSVPPAASAAAGEAAAAEAPKTGQHSSSAPTTGPSSSSGPSKGSGSGSSSSSTGGPLRIWIVDIERLGWRAFHYKTEDKVVSLKGLLEDGAVVKLMYDVRSDSSQLSKEFDVRLRGTYDLQLAEVAVRQLQQIPTTYVLPLGKALENHVERTPAFAQDMAASTAIAKEYHYSNKTEIWQQRPLTEELLQYAASDVKYLHQLYDALNRKLPLSIVAKVKSATIERITAPALASDQRASAPTIVRKSDLRQLMQTRTSPSGTSSSSSGAGRGMGAATQRSSTSSSAAAAVGSGSAGREGHEGETYGDGSVAGEGEGPKQRRPPPLLSLSASSIPVALPSEIMGFEVLPQGPGSSLEAAGAPVGSADASTLHEEAGFLAGQDGVQAGEAATAASAAITATSTSGPVMTATSAASLAASLAAPAKPFVLQPRKRAPGEEPPEWVKKAMQEEEEAKLGKAKTGNVQEAEGGQAAEDGGSADGAVAAEGSAAQGEAGEAGSGAAAPAADQEASKPGLPLLWGPKAAGAGARGGAAAVPSAPAAASSSSTTPQPVKPALQRPKPPRPGS